MGDDYVFGGFPLPDQNWTKLPHCLIAVLPLFKSLAELKCVLYILRHTWGFQEFGIPKKMTVDEFMHGRKRRDGTRLDAGTGLSKPAIINGLRLAEDHGYINVEWDEHDLGRVKKFYSLAMQGSTIFTPGVNDLDSNGQPSLPRTEKDTIERNLSKIWSDVLAEVEMVVDRSIYGRCYSHTVLVSLNDAHAEVRSPDPEWTAQQGRALLERTLSGVVGRDVSIEFV